ncbi:54S ribosomal protein L12 mitochondrial [Bienertia sinuspersici]
MKYLRFISHNFRTTQQNPKPKFLGFIQSSSNAISTRNYNTPSQESTPKSQPPPPKITAIADEISSLTLLEVADLTSLLGKKLEVKDLPMVSLMMPGMGFSLRGMGGAGGGAAAAAPAEEEKKEKTAFDLKLEAGFDAGVKIKIIKEVRSFTEFGLKEAKELVEKAPVVLKSGVSKEDAEKIIEKMKAVGAKVIME